MDNYCDNPLTPSRYCDNFFLTKEASIIALTSGSVSTISSIIAITVIIRSEIKLSSVYHRIIFAMCIFDIIGSIAMALNSIPMPKDQIYPFEGGSYGTVATCEAQSIAIFLGIVGSFHYTCGLCTFYLCIIQFKMSDRKIRRYLEPIIHVVSIISPLICISVLFSFELLNPSPYNVWCSQAPYPFGCTESEGVECVRGGSSNVNRREILITISAIFVVGMIAVLASMCVIFFGTVHFLSFNKAISPKIQKEWNSIKITLARQATMYFVAFLSVWTPSFMMSFFPSNFVFAMQVLLMPLQGFFNTLLFVSHKVHNTRQNDDKLTFWKALYFVVVSPVHAPEFRLYGLSKVALDQMRKENRGNEHSHKESVEEVIIAGQVGNSMVISNGDEKNSGISSAREINLSDFSIEINEEVSFMLDTSIKYKMEDGQQSNVINNDGATTITSLHPPRSAEETGMVGTQRQSEENGSNSPLSIMNSGDGLSFSQFSYSQQSRADLSGFSSVPL